MNTLLEPFNTEESGFAYILKKISLNPDGFDLILKR